MANLDHCCFVSVGYLGTPALLTQIGRKALRRVRNSCHTAAKRIVIPTPRTLSFRDRDSCHSEVENLVIPTPKGGGISFASKLGGCPAQVRNHSGSGFSA